MATSLSLCQLWRVMAQAWPYIKLWIWCRDWCPDRSCCRLRSWASTAVLWLMPWQVLLQTEILSKYCSAVTDVLTGLVADWGPEQVLQCLHMECNSNGERQRSIFGMKRKPYLDCYYTGSSNAKEVETASICGPEARRKDCATLASWQTATARPTIPSLSCSNTGITLLHSDHIAAVWSQWKYHS